MDWCRRGDLNPYRDYSPLDPESSASANSATSAYTITIGLKIEYYYFIFLHCKVKYWKRNLLHRLFPSRFQKNLVFDLRMEKGTARRGCQKMEIIVGIDHLEKIFY